MGTTARIILYVIGTVLATAGVGPAKAGQATAFDLPLSTGAEGIIFTQIPADQPGRIPQQPFPSGTGSRIMAVSSGGSLQNLTESFISACDPNISFDGTRILFAGKKRAQENWNIFEMATDGSGLRQVTRNLGDCRSPIYLPTLYTLNSEKPWYTIAFISTAAAKLDPYQASPSAHLYSCKLDGSEVRRLSYSPSSTRTPTILPNGRILFASPLRNTPARLAEPRTSLFGLNIDGTDLALFSGDQGRRIQHMPCITAEGKIIFVESDGESWDGAGQLASLDIRRNLHSYQSLTGSPEGLFHSPAPLGDGSILVSLRPADGGATHGLCRFHPNSGELEPLFDDPDYHDLQALALHRRIEPDGRSSVVDDNNPTGKLYCLDMYTTDLETPEWLPPGTVKRLRVLEGVAWDREKEGYFRDGDSPHGRYPIPMTRFLGEIDVEHDGSFNIQVPANTPIQLQALDADGLALRTCGWIWARNNEPRGCIGCHEDGELTPENRFVSALAKPSIPLTLPPERRRVVDFRRDVMPVLEGQCALPACHGGSIMPDLARQAASSRDSYARRAYGTLLAAHEPQDGGGAKPKYVVPGQARTSPLIWHILGRNTSRPWDPASNTAPAKMPGIGAAAKKILVEWIDLGAQWESTARLRKEGGEREKE